MYTIYTIEQLEELSPQELGEILLDAVIVDNTNYHYIKRILEAGADLDARTISGSTPLHCATYNGHIELIQILLDAGAPLEAAKIGGNTALHDAALFRNIAVVKVFLAAGASKVAKECTGLTPWDIANPYTRQYFPELNPNA